MEPILSECKRDVRGSRSASLSDNAQLSEQLRGKHFGFVECFQEGGNTRLAWLPPQRSQFLQPLDASYFAALKAHYTGHNPGCQNRPAFTTQVARATLGARSRVQTREITWTARAMAWTSQIK